MSDRKSSSTPIIVGAVIAVLGILTGLYIATNAREQMEAQNSNESQADAAALAEETDFSPDNADITAMPDLPAVEYAAAQALEEPMPESDAALVSEPETEAMTEVTEEQDAAQEEILPDVPDDFEPVTAEEMEEALPEQKEQSEEPQPAQE